MSVFLSIFILTCIIQCDCEHGHLELMLSQMLGLLNLLPLVSFLSRCCPSVGLPFMSAFCSCAVTSFQNTSNMIPLQHLSPTWSHLILLTLPFVRFVSFVEWFSEGNASFWICFVLSFHVILDELERPLAVYTVEFTRICSGQECRMFPFQNVCGQYDLEWLFCSGMVSDHSRTFYSNADRTSWMFYFNPQGDRWSWSKWAYHPSCSA